EVGAALGHLGVEAIDGLHAQQAVILLGVLGGPDLARDHVARAQAKAADLGERDVDVVGPREEARAAQEAEALVDRLERAQAEDIVLLFGAILALTWSLTAGHSGAVS